MLIIYVFLQIHIANVEKRTADVRAEEAHGEEPMDEENQEAGLLDGVAYATFLFLVFMSKHNLPFR